MIGGDGLTYDAANTSFSANVDDVTLEIVNDIIRVKDSGIANAKIANPFISFAAETGNTDVVSLGEVITFGAGEGINTQVSNNQILIVGELATTTNIGVASFNSSNFILSYSSLYGRFIEIVLLFLKRPFSNCGLNVRFSMKIFCRFA